jgi:hypothetical protein
MRSVGIVVSRRMGRGSLITGVSGQRVHLVEKRE